MSDELTIENLKAHSESAWQKAFEKLDGYGRVVLKNQAFAHNWPFGLADFKEFIDDGIVAVYNKINQRKSLDEVRKYFVRAIINAANTRIREQMARIRGGGKVLTTDDFMGLQGDVSTITLNDETIKVANAEDFIHGANDRNQAIKDILEDCLAEMNERDRVLITDLVINKDTKQKDVARKLGVGIGQIGNLKNQALDRLGKKAKRRLENELK